MAQKPKGAARKRPAQKGDNRERIIAAALDLAATRRWAAISLADIATAAKLTLAEVHATFPAKAAIINAFLERIDAEVLSGPPADAAEPARERLFEVIMRRFDALAPHKAAVGSIVRDGLADPLGGLVSLPRFMCSMAWMLEAAGISSAGLPGLMRTKGLALVYANALRVWLADDTADMAKTMAALDRSLRRAAAMVNACASCCGRRATAAGEATVAS